MMNEFLERRFGEGSAVGLQVGGGHGPRGDGQVRLFVGGGVCSFIHALLDPWLLAPMEEKRLLMVPM